MLQQHTPRTVRMRTRTLEMLIESSLCFLQRLKSHLCQALRLPFSFIQRNKAMQTHSEAIAHTHKCMLTCYTVPNTHTHTHTHTHIWLWFRPSSFVPALSSQSHTILLLSASLIHSIYLLFMKKNRAWPQPHTCRTACSFFKFISIIYAMQQRTDCLNNSACKYWNIL